MKGRKPIPAHLRALTGNPAKRPIGTSTLETNSGPLDRPSFLKGRAAEFFERLRAELGISGILTGTDWAALAMLAQRLDVWVDAISAPRFMKHKGRKCVTPEARYALECERLLWNALAEFGMTPSARMRVARKLVNDPSAPPDKFAEKYLKVANG